MNKVTKEMEIKEKHKQKIIDLHTLHSTKLTLQLNN